jgi:hypothetical protein
MNWTRRGDYNRNPGGHTEQCLTCYKSTFFKDRICGDCRKVVPEHIPTDQVKRYTLRIKKGNYHYA